MMTLLVQSEVELGCQLLDLEYVVDEPDRKALQMRFFGEHRIETDLIVERNIESGIRLDVAGCELLDGVDPASRSIEIVVEPLPSVPVIQASVLSQSTASQPCAAAFANLSRISSRIMPSSFMLSHRSSG